LGATAALLVATPLIPSEAAPAGISVVLTLGWLLLLTGCLCSAAWRGDFQLHVGLADIALICFLLLHTLSALVALYSGQPRQTLNMLWHWLGLGCAYLLLRHLLRHPAERRAMTAAMLALAVCLSLHGYYQYFHSFPQTRRAYEADAERTLAQAGIVAPPGSPQRANFENRLYSVEPLATFTLANSLAGFLAPWLLCAVGIAAWHWCDGALRFRLLTAAIVTAVPLTGCLLLTKSRTAWLASFLGLAAWLLFVREKSWRKGWKLGLGLLAVVGLLVAFAAATGGLDELVLTEALKSVSYRLEYWRSAAAMIRDYPWLGCGPGNFQQFYTAYKLPQASETIADPHNLVLEIWATAGTLTAVAFVAIFVGVAGRTWQSLHGDPHALESSEALGEGVARDSGGRIWPIYAGALAGLPLGVMIGFVVGFVPEGRDWPVLLLGWMVVATLMLGMWHRWVRQGRLPLVVILAALVATLANLSAAGGISFAGVSMTLWLLTALLMNETPAAKEMWTIDRKTGIALAAAAAILLVLFLQTTFQPVLNLSVSLAEAQMLLARGQLAAAEQACLAGTRIDSLSDDPWSLLAQVRQTQWLASRKHAEATGLQEAVNQRLARNRHSSVAQQEAGYLFLRAYRAAGRRQYLDQALDHFRRVVELYPSYNLGHAQLAWTLHLAGHEQEAARVAAEALRLDSVNPHSEQKLVRQQVDDPGPLDATQPAGTEGASAEHLMKLLRTGTQ